MLDSKIINKIESFVYSKPRTVQEIAVFLNKNWRTADRYVCEIEKNFGTIATRVFREGTRGALKIVYWSAIEKASSSIFQETLEKEINFSRNKESFSAFDIFQYVPKNKRELFVFEKEQNSVKYFSKVLLSAKKQILFFSGNLSFINLVGLLDVFEILIKKKISIKIICRVDFVGKENIEKILSLNSKHGVDLIEIRHNSHPLRGVVVDGVFSRLKEEKEPTGKIKELNKKMFIFYNILDKSWCEWLYKIFWKKFSNSIDAKKRLEILSDIKY